MIQVIGKVFDILDMLADATPEALPLSRIADPLGMHRATCANILRTLVVRGVVEQSVPRGGYTLGPALYYLVRGGAYRQDLVHAAQPVLDALARRLGETVLLAAISQGRRSIICQARARQSVQVSGDLLFLRDLYQTATGRLLLANADAAQRQAVVRENGLPARNVWPAAAGMAAMERTLEKIRRDGREINRDSSDVVQIAVSLREEGRVSAALGCFLPAYRYSAHKGAGIVAALEKAADKIIGRLGSPAQLAAGRKGG